MHNILELIKKSHLGDVTALSFSIMRSVSSSVPLLETKLLVLKKRRMDLKKVPKLFVQNWLKPT